MMFDGRSGFTGRAGSRTGARVPGTGTTGVPLINQAGELRTARLESLRALAAVGVVVAHAMYWAVTPPAADSPLDRVVALTVQAGPFLLFVLSGCLLFGPFARRDFVAGAPVSLRRYALNRMVRILPVYYAALAFGLVLLHGGGRPRDWLLYATFSQNFAIFPNDQVNRVMWFMAIEMQFYLVLPLLAWVIARVARGSRLRAAAVLGALGAASLALFHHAWHLAPTPDPSWRFSLPSTLFLLVAGMALTLLRVSWEQRRPAWLRGALTSSDLWVVAALGLVALAVALGIHIPATGAMVLILAVSVLLIGACVLPLRPGVLIRALQWRPLAIVGVASYSLLLCHDPVLQALASAQWTPQGWRGLLAIGLPLSLLAAFLSYALIEAPFLRLRRQWTRPVAVVDRKRHELASPTRPGPGRRPTPGLAATGFRDSPYSPARPGPRPGYAAGSRCPASCSVWPWSECSATR